MIVSNMVKETEAKNTFWKVIAVAIVKRKSNYKWEIL